MPKKKYALDAVGWREREKDFIPGLVTLLPFHVHLPQLFSPILLFKETTEHSRDLQINSRESHSILYVVYLIYRYLLLSSLSLMLKVMVFHTMLLLHQSNR